MGVPSATTRSAARTAPARRLSERIMIRIAALTVTMMRAWRSGERHQSMTRSITRIHVQRVELHAQQLDDAGIPARSYHMPPVRQPALDGAGIKAPSPLVRPRLTIDDQSRGLSDGAGARRAQERGLAGQPCTRDSASSMSRHTVDAVESTSETPSSLRSIQRWLSAMASEQSGPPAAATAISAIGAMPYWWTE